MKIRIPRRKRGHKQRPRTTPKRVGFSRPSMAGRTKAVSSLAASALQEGESVPARWLGVDDTRLVERGSSGLRFADLLTPEQATQRVAALRAAHTDEATA